MNIEGTVLEIIAKANKLKKIHDNLYRDEQNNKYQATQYGFVPNDIWDNEMLIRQHKIETEKLQSEINKLNRKLDDADYDKIVAQKELKKLMKKAKVGDGGNPYQDNFKTPEGYVSIYEECCPGMPIEVARKLYEDAKPKVTGLEFKGIIITGTKGDNEAEDYIELFRGDFTEEDIERCENPHCDGGIVGITCGEIDYCSICAKQTEK